MTTKEHHGAKYYWKCKGCTNIEYGIPDELCEKCKDSTPQEIKRRRLEVASTRSRKARQHLKELEAIKAGRRFCPLCGHEETALYNSHSSSECKISLPKSFGPSTRHKNLPKRPKIQQERLKQIRAIAESKSR